MSQLGLTKDAVCWDVGAGTGSVSVEMALLARGGKVYAVEKNGAALALLGENREAMDKIAEFLIEKETITGKEFMKIFRECKGIPEPEKESQESR